MHLNFSVTEVIVWWFWCFSVLTGFLLSDLPNYVSFHSNVTWDAFNSTKHSMWSFSCLLRHSGLARRLLQKSYGKLILLKGSSNSSSGSQSYGLVLRLVQNIVWQLREDTTMFCSSSLSMKCTPVYRQLLSKCIWSSREVKVWLQTANVQKLANVQNIK